MHLAVDFGCIARRAANARAGPGLIDEGRKALADLVFELAGADFLAVFHEAPVTALLDLWHHEREAKIIGGRARDRLIFEGARAVDLCLFEPIEKQVEILFTLAGKADDKGRAQG